MTDEVRPFLDRLEPLALPTDRLRVMPHAALRLAGWLDRLRGRPPRPQVRSWTFANDALDYGVVIAGDLRGPDPAALAAARDTLLALPRLGRALSAWLAAHDPTRAPDGGPLAWYFDHLVFGYDPAGPAARCRVEVHADVDDPADHDDRSWALDVGGVPNGPFVVSTPWRGGVHEASRWC